MKRRSTVHMRRGTLLQQGVLAPGLALLPPPLLRLVPAEVFQQHHKRLEYPDPHCLSRLGGSERSEDLTASLTLRLRSVLKMRALPRIADFIGFHQLALGFYLCCAFTGWGAVRWQWGTGCLYGVGHA
jgi:hypothetical protein